MLLVLSFALAFGLSALLLSFVQAGQPHTTHGRWNIAFGNVVLIALMTVVGGPIYYAIVRLCMYMKVH